MPKVKKDNPEPRIMIISHVIDKAWRNLLEQNVPPETHPDLVKTFKRFFYAGAKSLIDDLVYTDALDDGMEATPNDLQKIDAIMHEINEYFCEVVAGRQ
jgi:hypothetical protein